MKKVTLFLSAIVCVAIMTSCCGKKQGETEGATCDKAAKTQCDKEKPACNLTEEQKAEMQAFQEKWNNFDNLTADEQTELIAKKRECIEKRREEAKAKMAECEAKWANFDNLTIAEQKAFLDEAGCCKKAKCCDKKAECTKGKEKCTEGAKECTKEKAAL